MGRTGALYVGEPKLPVEREALVSGRLSPLGWATCLFFEESYQYRIQCQWRQNQGLAPKDLLKEVELRCYQTAHCFLTLLQSSAWISFPGL